MVPGLILFCLGLVMLCGLALGPVTFHGVTLSLNAMTMGLFASVVGLQLLLIGAIAQSLYDQTGRKRRRWVTLFAYNRAIFGSALVFFTGLTWPSRFLRAFVAAIHGG